MTSRRSFNEATPVELELRHLKRYPHFDSPLCMAEALKLVNDPIAVARHPFHPFIVVRKGYQPFRTPKGRGGDQLPKPKAKERLLRSAARRDAAVYAAYRARLAPLYEEQLMRSGLGESVIAYRSIPLSSDDERGKSNIHHAADAFREVAGRDRCVTVALDISGFFESIDHASLKRRWKEVLGVDDLPRDHYNVFKNITRYSWVEHKELYRLLGLTRVISVRDGPIEVPLPRGGKQRRKSSAVASNANENLVPLQLCTPTVFRDEVCGQAPEATSIVRANELGYGIPQGSPISDLLANMSLLEFDREMLALADRLGGIYRRYSDDMLLVFDGGLAEGEAVRDEVIREISNHGEQLRIKPSKTNVVAFERDGARQRAISRSSDERQLYALEYLGFQFDGLRVRFRQSTVSRLRRRIRRRVKREAKVCVRRYPGATLAELERKFRTTEIEQAVGRVPRADRFGEERKDTFYGYARRAIDIFGPAWADRLLQEIPYRRWISLDRRLYLERYRLCSVGLPKRPRA